MVRQREHLDHAIPDRLTLEGLGHRHGLDVLRAGPVKVQDGLLKRRQLGSVRHAAAASRSSSTVQTWSVMPAAIAGVTRSER